MCFKMYFTIAAFGILTGIVSCAAVDKVEEGPIETREGKR